MTKTMPRFRALVLADDPGLRMRPLTGSVPKALLPIAGQPLVGLALTALAQAGCEAALVRVGPLGGSIEDRFGADLDGMELHYSAAPEDAARPTESSDPKEEALGAEGAARGPLSQLAEFLRGAEVAALVPANRACRWPIQRLLKRHVKRGAAATLLVGRDQPRAPATTWVELQKKGWVSELRGRSAAHNESGGELKSFLGVCLLDGQCLLDVDLGRGAMVGEEGASLLGLLRRWQGQGKPLLGVETRRPLFELPTPLRYLDTVTEWSRGGFPARLVRRRFVSNEAQIEKRVRVRRSVVEEGAVLERGSRLEDSLVLEGATVGVGSRIEHSIVAPGVLLSPHTRLSGRLVTPLKAGRAPGANDSVVGDLVYTPLGRI